MGLDMYLHARLHTSAFSEKEENAELRVVADKMLPPAAQDYDSISIERQAAYWRKANAIHKWFVDNVQDGRDECQQVDVELDQLKQLHALCVQVRDGSELVDGVVTNGYTFSNGVEQPITEKGKRVANPELAHSLLPTQSGFFFGSTDYDQWYMADIENTIEQLERIFLWVDANKREYGHKPGEFYCPVNFTYQASW